MNTEFNSMKELMDHLLNDGKVRHFLSRNYIFFKNGRLESSSGNTYDLNFNNFCDYRKYIEAPKKEKYYQVVFEKDGDIYTSGKLYKSKEDYAVSRSEDHRIIDLKFIGEY